MQKNLKQLKQKGQAMVETAIVLPLLVLLLLGVGYFGSVIMTDALESQIQHAVRFQIEKIEQQEKDNQHYDNNQDGRATAGTLAVESSHKASSMSVVSVGLALPEKAQQTLVAVLNQP